MMGSIAVPIRYGEQRLTHRFDIADTPEGISVIIGRDLMAPLGIAISGLLTPAQHEAAPNPPADQKAALFDAEAGEHPLPIIRIWKQHWPEIKPSHIIRFAARQALLSVSIPAMRHLSGIDSTASRTMWKNSWINRWRSGCSGEKYAPLARDVRIICLY